MKLIQHSYLVLSLGNCAHKTHTETGLTNKLKFDCNVLQYLSICYKTSQTLKKTEFPAACLRKKKRPNFFVLENENMQGQCSGRAAAVHPARREFDSQFSRTTSVFKYMLLKTTYLVQK